MAMRSSGWDHGTRSDTSEWCSHHTAPTDEAWAPATAAAAAELAVTSSHVTEACCSSSCRMYANASSSWHLRNSASRVTFETASRRSCSSVSTPTPFCDDDVTTGFTCWTDSLTQTHSQSDLHNGCIDFHAYLYISTIHTHTSSEIMQYVEWLKSRRLCLDMSLEWMSWLTPIEFC